MGERDQPASQGDAWLLPQQGGGAGAIGVAGSGRVKSLAPRRRAHLMAVTGRQKSSLYLTPHPAMEPSQMAALILANSRAASKVEMLAGSTAWAIWFQWPATEEVAAGSGARAGLVQILSTC